MATIGVTRGLGDHNLKVCSSTLPIKPFLSCFPEVSRMGASSARPFPLQGPKLVFFQGPFVPQLLFQSLLPARCECTT